jgi:hypothetical protein
MKNIGGYRTNDTFSLRIITVCIPFLCLGCNAVMPRSNMAKLIISSLSEIKQETRENEFQIFIKRESNLFQYLPLTRKGYVQLKSFTYEVLEESSSGDLEIAVEVLIEEKKFLELALLCLSSSKTPHAKHLAALLNSVIDKKQIEQDDRPAVLYCIYLATLYTEGGWPTQKPMNEKGGASAAADAREAQADETEAGETEADDESE